MEVESTGKHVAVVVSSDHRAESGVSVVDPLGIREEEEEGLGVVGCSSIIDRDKKIYPHTSRAKEEKVVCVCERERV